MLVEETRSRRRALDETGRDATELDPMEGRPDRDESDPGASRLLAAFARRLANPTWSEQAALELGLCRAHGVTVMRRGERGWPSELRDLSSTPAVLFSRGRWEPADDSALAIVGTRRPSPYGLRQAKRFARAFASAGLTVVSGLARGIDIACHREALRAGGRTIAVLGSGLGRVYPPENAALLHELCENEAGAVITEFPYETPPRKHHFPQRNRLLSGLSRALLVVEAGERSGTLLTVDWALEQGRPVFAVPGRVDEPQARGVLRLIQSGAHPVLDPQEVLEVLGFSSGLGHASGRAGSSGEGDRGGRSGEEDRGGRPDLIFDELLVLFREKDHWHADELVERLDFALPELLAELSRLETSGKIRREHTGQFVLDE